MKNVRFIGLDVHAETIAVAVAEPGGEVRSLGTIPNRPEPIHEYQSDQPSTTATPTAAHLRLTEKPQPRPDHHHLKDRSISAYCRPRMAASLQSFRHRQCPVLSRLPSHALLHGGHLR
jgi:hypothetical protein